MKLKFLNLKNGFNNQFFKIKIKNKIFKFSNKTMHGYQFVKMRKFKSQLFKLATKSKTKFINRKRTAVARPIHAEDQQRSPYFYRAATRDSTYGR